MFAESYDDPSNSTDVTNQTANKVTETPEPTKEDKSEFTDLVYDMSACPNKINRYHKCSEFCDNQWGRAAFKHIENLNAKHERLLRKHPLPDNWLEVGDPST